tara:strand:- start:142 stop:594 length:453 start_codon:yes stop_codon:yes gene_type:complete
LQKLTILPFLFCIIFTSCKDRPAKGLGLTSENKFFPCPETPNCVSSFENPSNERNFISPIKFFGGKEATILKLEKLIKKNPSAKIVEKKENYLRAEYTSSVFKFVDDIQFYFGQENTIHVKSASRVGRSDFGKNRERVREIEFALQQSAN